MGSSINKIKFLGRKFFGIRNLSTAPTYDPDAQNYFNANTAITSTADKNAINTFYLGLKSDGIYTKIKAMYLPIWGSASACKWNLVNPLDTNAAFRLTFSTGITYASSGITFNGTSAYADTFLLPSTQLSLNSSHISLYTRTNTTGIWAGTDNSYRFWITPNFNNVSGYNEINTGAPDVGQTFTRSLLTSHWISSRTASTTTKLFNKTNLIATNTLVSRGLDNYSIYLGARNVNNIANNFSGIQLSFSSIGNGLTDTEATNFYNRVQTLMTYFGINV